MKFLNSFFYSTLLLVLYMIISVSLKFFGVDENIIKYLLLITPFLTIFIGFTVTKIILNSNNNKKSENLQYFPRINN